MIKFINLKKETPYIILRKKYDEAFKKGQKSIEAAAISSYNNKKGEVESRFVNIKFVDKDNFIFFSNYKSPKSLAFESHNQISALIYWNSINIQIRMKSKISKTSIHFNKNYFKGRSLKKNALAISSQQSSYIESYEGVQQNFSKALNSSNLSECPEYWGGFSFAPYYFEFWEGHKSRLNKRDVYEKVDDAWNHHVLQP